MPRSARSEAPSVRVQRPAGAKAPGAISPPSPSGAGIDGGSGRIVVLAAAVVGGVAKAGLSVTSRPSSKVHLLKNI